MAYENIKFNKPNMAIVDGYFYSLDETTNSLWIKLADGTLVAQFPTDTLLGNPVKSLQYDGHYIWSLQDDSDGFLIRCWELRNCLCRLIRFFTFHDTATINYSSSTFGVEHYITFFSSSLAITSDIITVKEYYDNIIYTNVTLTLGPNSAGEYEDVVVDYVDGTDIHLIDKTKHVYKENDLVSFSKSLLIFNDYNGLSSLEGSIICVDSHDGSTLTTTSGIEYKDVKAATFCRLKNTFSASPDAYSLIYIKGTNAKLRNMEDLVSFYVSSTVNDPFITNGSLATSKKWSIEYGDPEIINEALFLSTIAGEKDSLKSKWAVLSDFNATVSGSIIDGTTFLPTYGETRNFLKMQQLDGTSLEVGVGYLEITPLDSSDLLIDLDMSLTDSGTLYDKSGNANVSYLMGGATVTSGVLYNSLDLTPNAYSYTTYSGVLASGVEALTATFWATLDNFNDTTLFAIKSEGSPIKSSVSWTTGAYSNNAHIYKVLEIVGATSLKVTIIGETEHNYDFVTIYDEDNNLIFRSSGNFNTTFYTSGNKITAHLDSDVSVTKSGVTVTIEGDIPPINIEIVSNSSASTVVLQSTGFSDTIESNTLQIDRWYCIAFTFNSGNISLYIDGRLIGTIASDYSSFEYIEGDWLYLGHFIENSSDYFSGQIHDVKVYNTALSATDISAVYYGPSKFNNRLNFYNMYNEELSYIAPLSSGITNYILGIDKVNGFVSSICKEVSSSGISRIISTVPFSTVSSEAKLSLGLYSINATASGVILNDFIIDNGLIHYPNNNEVLYGIANLENVKSDQSTLLPVYAISIMDTSMYRLQKGATYYGTDNSWSTYNYQLTPLRPFIDFITVGVKPTILPANGKNVADIDILVKDQYGNPALDKPVILSDDNAVGFITTPTVYTGDAYSKPGEATGVYKAGVDITPVLITAKVTQYD